MTPVATFILVVTSAVSLVAIYGSRDMSSFVFSPFEIKRRKKYFQFISSGFLHADLMHLLFNMLTLYFFADSVEEVTGGVRFAMIYFGSMIFADLPSFFKHKDNPDFRSLGASGAVSGIIFSSILFNPTASMMIFPIPIPIPAPIFAVLYLVYCTVAARKSQDNINHSAHFWGAVAGLLLTIIIFPGVVGYFFSALSG